MSYKPLYCCQCSEKIERKVWRPWTNRRFCQLCETNFGIHDNIKNSALLLLGLISIIGIGNMLRTPPKALVITPNQLAGNYGNSKKQSVGQTNQPLIVNQHVSQIPDTRIETNSSEQAKQPIRQLNQNKVVKQTEKPSSDQTTEVVYFCGAQTKKGAPCTRRVKNGGRCWQHRGQPAMLPQQKLLASQ